MIAGYKTTNPHTKEPTEFIEQIMDGRKKHTIREGDRWRTALHNAKKRNEDLIIQHCTGRRTKAFKEHYRHKVISVQDIFVTFNGWALEISIDDKYHYLQDKNLWMNDGFKKIEDFRTWFSKEIGKDGEFKGEIIHWTDLRY